MSNPVEIINEIERKLTISIESAALTEEINKKLKDIAKRANIQGFRRGKAPMNIVKQRYATSAEADAIDSLINSTLRKALQDNNLKPVAPPNVDIIEQNEQGLKYVADFEIYPEITLNDLTNLEVERVNCDINDNDIDVMIENLRFQQVKFEATDREIAQKDDQLQISFVGKLDGVPFEGGTSNDFTLVLGSGKMIPGFEEQIEGAKLNEEKTFNITFPTDYQASHLAGKETEFTIVVKSIKVPKLPEVDENFWKYFGVTEGGVEAFRAEVSKNMNREVTRAKKTILRDSVMNALVEANDFTLPKSLVDLELNQLKNQLDFYSQLSEEELLDSAKRRLKLSLIIMHIVEKEKIKADKSHIDSLIADIASAYQDPQEVIEFYKKDKDAYQNVYGTALEEQVIDYILTQAKITEKQSNYKDIMALAYHNMN